MESILKVLLPKARDPMPIVASQIITSLGELAEVGNKAIIPYLDEMMSVIIDTLQDQSSPMKREAALKTLGQVSSNTGWVIEPYLKYPNLLNLLIKILKTEPSPTIRKETVKVMGVLGALDPYKHQTSAKSAESSGPTSQFAEFSALPMGVTPSSEEYYPTIAIGSLMKILCDPSLSAQHTAVVTALMFIVNALGLKCVPYLPQVKYQFLSYAFETLTFVDHATVLEHDADVSAWHGGVLLPATLEHCYNCQTAHSKLLDRNHICGPRVLECESEPAAYFSITHRSDCPGSRR